jgi:hypothetical protein
MREMKEFEKEMKKKLLKKEENVGDFFMFFFKI